MEHIYSNGRRSIRKKACAEKEKKFPSSTTPPWMVRAGQPRDHRGALPVGLTLIKLSFNLPQVPDTNLTVLPAQLPPVQHVTSRRHVANRLCRPPFTIARLLPLRALYHSL
jgi:hypothetical protein